jgi:putative membrane protein insertion efficiency factor
VPGKSEETKIESRKGRHKLLRKMPNIPKLVVLQLLRAYKWAISPMFPPACRYVPTCSEYAMEAIERYGILRGGSIALTRLLRCHPFAHGGYDPVTTNREQHGFGCAEIGRQRSALAAEDRGTSLRPARGDRQ